MAIEKTICAVCGKGDGVFVFRGDKWKHKECAVPVRVMRSPVFPFETRHIVDQNDVREHGPVVINDIRELRRYERQSGTVCDPFSNSSDYQNQRY